MAWKNEEVAKAYGKEYYLQNKDKWKISAIKKKLSGSKAISDKKYNQNNKEKIRAMRILWKSKNRDKIREQTKRYRLKYPEKRKAHNQVQWFKSKNNKCSKCDETKDLHFHHTNYGKNEGITLCRKCHNEVHNNGG